MTVLLVSAALMALLVFPPAKHADAVDRDTLGAIVVKSVGPLGELTLANGDRLCLPGIWVPTASDRKGESGGWRSAWRGIIEKGAYFRRAHRSEHANRYGCRVIDIKSLDGTSLADAFLEAGWAVVDPLSAPGDAEAVDAMLSLEDRARLAGWGIWRQAAVMPKKADELAGWIGTRQIIVGRVRRVSGNDRYIYLNFGADWRTDFTVRLD